MLDPGFRDNGLLYVYWSPLSPERFRVSRFGPAAPLTAQTRGAVGLGLRGDLASELVIWEDTDTGGYPSLYHFGGSLDFGPDGLLYLTTGDHSNPEWAQILTSSAGAVHRFHSNGSVPRSNFGLSSDGPGGIVDTIWAWGLRNPYRARWDLVSQTYYISETGSNNNNQAYEDLHIGAPGKNFGWPWLVISTTRPAMMPCSMFSPPSPPSPFP